MMMSLIRQNTLKSRDKYLCIVESWYTRGMSLHVAIRSIHPFHTTGIPHPHNEAINEH